MHHSPQSQLLLLLCYILLYKNYGASSSLSKWNRIEIIFVKKTKKKIKYNDDINLCLYNEYTTTSSVFVAKRIYMKRLIFSLRFFFTFPKLTRQEDSTKKLKIYSFQLFFQNFADCLFISWIEFIIFLLFAQWNIYLHNSRGGKRERNEKRSCSLEWSRLTKITC
jgi:hypothetical protein